MLNSNRSRFVWKYGVLAFGVPAGLALGLWVAATEYSYGIMGSVLTILYYVAVMCVGGVLFGRIMWRLGFRSSPDS